MSDNRNDKYEEHDDSEYHFTDEEVNYEVETETSKMPPAAGGEQKANLGTRLTQSKRMLASLGVFLVLVVIVYKVVSPSSSVPSTDIAAAPTVVSQELSGPVTQMPANTEQTPQVVAVPTVPTTPAPATTIPTAPTTPTAPVMPSSVASQAPAAPNQVPATVQQSPQVGTVPPGSSTVSTVATVPMPSTISPAPAAPSQVPPPQAAAQQPDAGQVASMPAPQIIIQQAPQPQPPTVSNMPPSQNSQQMAGLPSVIPVQPPVPAYSNAPPSIAAQQAADAADKAAALSAISQKGMEQLQAQYSQQYNEFTSQSKVLQNQVQTLSSRVAVMESQLSQLVQALTQRVQENSAGAPDTNQVMPAPPTRSFDGKISYNVQAIIPGRAWLKAENGETLTVAEGDIIRGVGRVTKIDPYDGVVEINTGSKAISLSYGNGG